MEQLRHNNNKEDIPLSCGLYGERDENVSDIVSEGRELAQTNTIQDVILVNIHFLTLLFKFVFIGFSPLLAYILNMN